MSVKYISNYASLAAVTEATTSTAVGIGKINSFTAYFNVVSGSSSQTVTNIVEITPDGTNWYTVDSQVKTASVKYAVSFANVNAQQVRTRTASQVDTTVTSSITIGA